MPEMIDIKTALLLIDIQNEYFKGGKSELVNSLAALENAEKVLKQFREHKSVIIHVQHINIQAGATYFLPETEGVQIHEKLKPLKNEFVVVKHTPNSFYKTDLKRILEENGIDSLVVCGMMSHMCVDTTVRAAKDYGIAVTLIEDACATKNLVFKGETIPAATVHGSFMASLDKMFAKIVKTDDYMRDSANKE